MGPERVGGWGERGRWRGSGRSLTFVSDGFPTFFFPCTSSRGSVAPDGIIGFGLPGVLSIFEASME